MIVEFSGEVWFWKGPAPWHFVTVPEQDCGALESAAGLVTYGWGMIPATVRVGATEWPTALWPKDGQYIVPLKAWVRKAEQIELGDTVSIRVTVDI